MARGRPSFHWNGLSGIPVLLVPVAAVRLVAVRLQVERRPRDSALLEEDRIVATEYGECGEEE